MVVMNKLQKNICGQETKYKRYTKLNSINNKVNWETRRNERIKRQNEQLLQINWTFFSINYVIGDTFTSDKFVSRVIYKIVSISKI